MIIIKKKDLYKEIYDLNDQPEGWEIFCIREDDGRCSICPRQCPWQPNPGKAGMEEKTKTITVAEYAKLTCDPERFIADAEFVGISPADRFDYEAIIYCPCCDSWSFGNGPCACV